MRTDFALNRERGECVHFGIPKESDRGRGCYKDNLRWTREKPVTVYSHIFVLIIYFCRYIFEKLNGSISIVS